MRPKNRSRIPALSLLSTGCAVAALLMVVACDGGATHEGSAPRAKSGAAPSKASTAASGETIAKEDATLAAPPPETIKGVATPAEIGRVGTLILKALAANDATAMKSYLVTKDYFTAERTRKALAMGPSGAALSEQDAAALWDAMMETSNQAVEGMIKNFGGAALEVAEVRVGAVEMHGELRLYRGIVVAVRDNAQALTDLRFMGSVVEDTVSGDYFILGFLPIKKDGSLAAAG